jgi:hypothetical protein
MKTVRSDLASVQSNGAVSARRPYRAPQVRELGSVQKLTLNMGTVQQNDTATHQTGKTVAV